MEPWITFKDNREQAAAQIRLALNLIRFYAIISSPFIPDASSKLMDEMHTCDNYWPKDVRNALEALSPGHEFTLPEVTFRKITDEQRKEWKVRFAGKNC